MKELKLKMNELKIKHIVNPITLLGKDILGDNFANIVKSNLEEGEIWYAVWDVCSNCVSPLQQKTNSTTVHFIKNV